MAASTINQTSDSVMANAGSALSFLAERGSVSRMRNRFALAERNGDNVVVAPKPVIPLGTSALPKKRAAPIRPFRPAVATPAVKLTNTTPIAAPPATALTATTASSSTSDDDSDDSELIQDAGPADVSSVISSRSVSAAKARMTAAIEAATAEAEKSSRRSSTSSARSFRSSRSTQSTRSWAAAAAAATTRGRVPEPQRAPTTATTMTTATVVDTSPSGPPPPPTATNATTTTTTTKTNTVARRWKPVSAVVRAAKPLPPAPVVVPSDNQPTVVETRATDMSATAEARAAAETNELASAAVAASGEAVIAQATAREVSTGPSRSGVVLTGTQVGAKPDATIDPLQLGRPTYRALQALAATRGTAHPSYVTMLCALAAMHAQDGDATRALRAYAYADTLVVKHHGEHHASRIALTNNMALILKTLERYQEALEKFNLLRALMAAQPGSAADQPALQHVVSVVRKNHAVVMQALGRWDEVESEMAATRRRITETAPPAEVAVATLRDMAELYELTGHGREANEVRDQLTTTTTQP